MKLTTFLACLLFCFSLACHAQSPKKTSFEVGVDMVSFQNAYNRISVNVKDYSILSGVSGIFFQYHIKRFGLRTSVNYNYAHKELNNKNCADCITGTTFINTFNIKMGVAFQLLRHKEWLYAFADFQNRQFKQKGNRTGGFAGIDYIFDYQIKGRGLSIGLGAKHKLFKSLHLSYESSFNALYNVYNLYSTEEVRCATGLGYLNGSTSIYPSFRLLLTAKF